MPIREPRRMVIYIDDEVHHFRSVRNGIMFFAEHLGISFGCAKSKINMACRKSEGYFKNFRFVKDPSYVTSRPVVGINLITGDYIIFPSVNKAGEYIFGKHDQKATAYISKLCKNGKTHDASGLTFKYIKNGYAFSPMYHNTEVNRAILQLNKDTEAFINYFHSVVDAATHIFDLGISKSSVKVIATSISSRINGKNPSCNTPYGFKWRYV